MRTEKAVTNLKMAMVYQACVLFMSFVDRKLFLEILGIEYLGVHGLFGNMISMLALAELGVGTAIIYNLYKPLAEQNEAKVSALMSLYRKMYFYIGLVILVLGMGMMVTLPIFIQDVALPMKPLYIAYGIFVLGTVATYWTGYKRSLLYADQRNYVAQVGDMACTVGGAVLKILTLVFAPSYTLYVIVHVISKIIPNIYAAFKVNQLYPYLKKYKEVLVGDEKTKVTNNVKDLFVHKMSFFVVNSTDNMIISFFTGVATVGFVGNYQIIISAIMSFIGQGIDSLQASLGNLVTTEKKEQVVEVYDKIQFAVFWVASVTSVCLMGLITPFVSLWLGEEYVLSYGIVLVMLLNFVLWVMTRPIWQMMSVSGLFKEDKYNALAEMLVNLVFSLILVQKIGVMGVFLGTSCSYLVSWVLKAVILHKKFFGEGLKKYAVYTIGYVGLIMLELIFVEYILRYTVVDNAMLTFVFKLAVCAVVPNVINLLIFMRYKHFIYYKELVIMQIKKVEKIDRFDTIFTKVIMVLLMIIPFHHTIGGIEVTIGKFCSMAIALISMAYIVYQGIVRGNVSKKRQYHIWLYGVFCVAILLYGIVTGGEEGLRMAGYMIAVTCTGVAASCMNWQKLGRGAWLADIGILAWLYYIVKLTMPLENKNSLRIIFGNSNLFGAFILFMICIIAMLYGITKGERYILYIVLYLPFLIMSDSRGSMIAVLGAVICYMIWLVSSRWRVTHYSIIVVLFLGLAGLVYIYPQLTSLEGIGEFNVWIRELTSKSLFSGRETMWIQALDALKEQPMWGYGLNTNMQEIFRAQHYAWNRGAHNQFIQIALWGGMVGVTLATVACGYLWHLFYKTAKCKTTRIGASVFVAVFVISMFESFTLGEIVPFGIMQWCIIGIGLSACTNNNNKENIEEIISDKEGGE
ncbi:MAG: O-antigen ligase family protein [Cellulosilyticaceae bacterium]